MAPPTFKIDHIVLNNWLPFMSIVLNHFAVDLANSGAAAAARKQSGMRILLIEDDSAFPHINRVDVQN